MKILTPSLVSLDLSQSPTRLEHVSDAEIVEAVRGGVIGDEQYDPVHHIAVEAMQAAVVTLVWLRREAKAADANAASEPLPASRHAREDRSVPSPRPSRTAQVAPSGRSRAHRRGGQ